MRGLLEKIAACNAWEPGAFVPLVARGVQLGSLRHTAAEALRAWPRAFQVTTTAVEWIDAPATFAGRTAALEAIALTLCEQGLLPDRQDEWYPVTASGPATAWCLIDRAWAPFFGMRAFGQHLNGYVRTARGLEMWVARRAADRRHYPGRLDNLVGGGLPYGLGLAENLRKECAEEAGMAAELADRALPVGAVTYCRDAELGLKPDVMFCYDLELPDDFQPRCTDGEVESFERISLEEISTIVRETDAFKLNCNLVIIDFMIRHGLIPQDDPDYIAIVQGLRSPLPASTVP
ncbi:DUF4743 domain-containing protein [Thiocapsa imhoffii]|uniref:DUF4743 domain-containing protein n=1 Tax=Thiocapsa imhoffii TaxID=382777 RepID=A0A9X0WK47_9GAMM|nr:DUF4743 domain-containing protein [Thiocapsa imhoffii]